MATLAQSMAKLDKAFNRDPSRARFFNIMINDLLSFIDNAVPEINSLLYTDNLVLWATGSDIPKLESTLNSTLVTLANWSLENDFKLLIRQILNFSP
ncbi:hypothetical protein TNIN_97431 [Trichonephila inaurata madagascariensis]|uniref:Uncharacterized protein n=1 Tax=Trichonephila inaurata madagascariensis TaxID=2747483 RepID=A0A8X6JVX5_9ARAC|nr:hypothetical protein TNIN_97431 [Trichonephila inaurata madagascariensis]